MSKVKIISEQTIFSGKPGRQGKEDMLVMYQIDEDTTRTFLVTLGYEDAVLPTGQPNEANIIKAIKENEAKRLPTLPRSFTL
jgi:hypothetical protein